jgi:hypothetical protein
MKLTIHLHLVPPLIMSGTVFLFPNYAFIPWRRITFFFPFFSETNKESFGLVVTL